MWYSGRELMTTTISALWYLMNVLLIRSGEKGRKVEHGHVSVMKNFPCWELCRLSILDRKNIFRFQEVSYRLIWHIKPWFYGGVGDIFLILGGCILQSRRMNTLFTGFKYLLHTCDAFYISITPADDVQILYKRLIAFIGERMKEKHFPPSAP